MHPRLAELADALARHRAALLAAVAAVPTADLDRRPDADAWSVAEVLDHLARVEGGTARLLAKRVARARESGVGADPHDDSVLGRLDGFDVAHSPLPRVAPEMVRPASGVSAADALSALDASRQALLATLKDADGLDLTKVLATHAALGELDGYQWVLFIGQHEARHARQIAAIARALAGVGDTRTE
jgi:uncharacterized damage-inducible protein DinB